MLAIGASLFLLGANQIIAFTLLYVLVRAVRTLFLIHWWNYVSDFFNTSAAKRVVPVITSASRIAIIVAGFTIPLLDRFLSPAGIILLWIATLLVVALISWVMSAVVKAQAESETILAEPAGLKKERGSYLRNIQEGFRYISSSNYLKWVALSTFLMVVVFALLNYQGGQIFINQFQTRVAMTNFIGYLNGLTSLLMLPVQMFLFSRIVGKIGVGNANIIFPLGTFLISGSVLLAPLSLTSGALAYFDRNTFRYSTQEASNNLLYNAVPRRIKGRSRSFNDGLILPLGLLFSSALLEFGKTLPAGCFLPVLLGIPALMYLICALIIRKKYSHAMISLLEQEDYTSLLPSSDATGLSVDSGSFDTLIKKLNDSQDDAISLLIARILTDATGSSAIPFLEKKAKESSASLRTGIIDLVVSAGRRDQDLQRFCNSFLDDTEAGVRLAALNGLLLSANSENKELLDRASRFYRDPDFQVRKQALIFLLNSKNSIYNQPAMAALNELLHDPDVSACVCALDVLGTIGEAGSLPLIISHLVDDREEIRLHAVKALAMRSKQNISSTVSDAILDSANRLLADPSERVRIDMLSLLDQLHLPNMVGLIVIALNDVSPQVREMARKILVKIGGAAVPTLESHLASKDNRPLQQTLIKVVLCQIDGRKYGWLVEALIQEDLKKVYDRNAQLAAIHDFKEFPGVLVLRALLEELNRSSMDEIFALLSARYGEKPVRIISQSLNSGSSHQRANGSEALESLVNSQSAKLLRPFLENDLSSTTLARISSETWGTRPVTPAEAMRSLVSEPKNELVRAFSIYVLGEIATDGNSAPVAEMRSRQRSRNDFFDNLSLSDSSHNSVQDNLISPASNSPQFFSMTEVHHLSSLALTDPFPEVRSAAQVAERMIDKTTHRPSEGDHMTDSLSVIERILFIKQVDFFRGLTIDQLKVLANICEEEFFRKGMHIFREGEPGGVLFIVVNGRVGIEREGERKGSILRLVTLESRSSFGEMNLFDNSPRSASALAIEDTLVLKLRREPLVTLMRQYPDMLLELVKFLSQRIRDANDQIAHLTRAMPRQLHQLYDKLEESK